MDLVILVFTVALNAFLGAIVYSKNRKSPANRLFLFFITSVVLWSISNFVVDKAAGYNLALVWTKVTFIWSFYIPVLLYFFTNKFPIQKRSRSPILHFILPVLFTAATLLNQVVVGLVDPNIHPITPTFGALYYPFVIYFIVYIVVALKNVLSAFKQTTGIKKEQIKYLFIGLLLSTVFAALTNLILPVFGYSQLSNYGVYGLGFFIVLTYYAITRHRLFDIRLVITRSLVYGIVLSLVSLSFILVTFLSAQYFGDNPQIRFAVGLAVAILIVFGLDPLKSLLSNITDKFFFKAKIDYQAVLRLLSETLNFELDQNKLIRELRVTLQQELKLKNVATLLRKPDENGIEQFDALPEILTKNPEMSLKNESPLVRYLRQHRHVAILESLERKLDDASDNERGALEASKHEFERLDVALVYPIFAQGHLIAILTLGQKLSGDSFSNDDLQLIEVLGPQIGSAIQKANLFEEVKEFSAGLQQKVEAATSELRERNTSLQTLQRITREITRTLDFNQVVQQIADAVAMELGYMGAILVFLDEDQKTVRARAISRTPLTAKVITMLPTEFNNLTSRLDDDSAGNLAQQVLRHGEIMMTRSMPQVISPPVPKLLAAEIQKVLHIKTMVVVPINSEGRTIGCIEIGVQRLQEEITKSELDTMQSLADELGVLARNLSLFSAIQRTNEQLEEANKHLQALDQAKSEFVSIASHQLRTPMTGIMGYLSMMTEGDFGKLAPEHEKILRELLSESQRMIRLINQFLNVSKIEAGKFSYEKKPVNLTELVQKQVNELRKGAEDKGLKLTFKPPLQPLPITMADPDKLEDVILNLIDNAVKYTAKGSVTIKVEATPTELHFSSTDTGIGIKASDAHELFNKFVRGQGIAQIHPDGSGLGLFIAKSIIDAQGGKIWAESAGEGKGSTFRFTIPIVQPITK